MGGLPVTPGVTATPKPRPTLGELVALPARGPGVWHAVVYCGHGWAVSSVWVRDSPPPPPPPFGPSGPT